MRLDALKEFLQVTGLSGQAGISPLSSNVVRRRTGPKVDLGHKTEALPDNLLENWPQEVSTAPEPTGELAPDPLEMTAEALTEACSNL